MWIYTQYGFFSVVQLFDNQVQVRSRRKEHLVELQKCFPYIQGYPIDSRSGTDYEHRIIMQKSEWVVLAAALADDVDYENFKARVNSMEEIDGWHDPLNTEWTLGVYPKCLGDVYISTATTLAEGNEHGEEAPEEAMDLPRR